MVRGPTARPVTIQIHAQAPGPTQCSRVLPCDHRAEVPRIRPRCPWRTHSPGDTRERWTARFPGCAGSREQNLRFALPDLGHVRHAEIIDGVFRSIARILVTFAKFPSIRRDISSTWIRLEGGEHFEAALRGGRGVLVATAHLGNWEFSAFAHALMTAPMNVVVRPLDNPLIDAMVERRRALSGNRPIGKKDFARSILKALAANQAVGILIDQNASLDTGVFVDFFGVTACAEPGLRQLRGAQRGRGDSRLRALEPSRSDATCCGFTRRSR